MTPTTPAPSERPAAPIPLAGWARTVTGALVLGVLVVACDPLASGRGARVGYGDTVIRYAERSYEGSAWVERPEAAALSARAKTSDGARVGALKFITGLDEANFWIVDALGNLFRLKEGHWSYERAIAGGMAVLTARATAAGGIVVGGSPHDKGLAIWRADGIRTFKTARSGVLASGHIHVLAEDYIQYFAIAGAANIGTSACRLVSDQMVQIEPKKDPAYFVHSAGNVPLRDMGVPYIRATATFESPTEAYGLWRIRSKKSALLRFQNGTWVLVDELTRDFVPARSFWFGEDDVGRFLIAAGVGGLVLSHPFGGATVDQSLNANPQVPTSADLIAVWGVDRHTFWVMDSNGTVWRRADNTWVIVIRGLYDQDVEFRDVYVAPGGAVHAITENSVYLLN